MLAQCFEELSRQPKAAAIPAPVSDAWRQILASVPSPDVLTRFAMSERLTAFSLSDVFPKNLVAAQSDGLLTLGGLDHPLELTGSILGPGNQVFESLERSREHTGGFVAIDSPEFALAAQPREPAEFVRELRAGLRDRIGGDHQSECGDPPDFRRDLGDGPLFAEVRQPVDPKRLAALADAIADELAPNESQIEIAWHLNAADFAKDKAERLVRLAMPPTTACQWCFIWIDRGGRFRSHPDWDEIAPRC